MTINAIALNAIKADTSYKLNYSKNINFGTNQKTEQDFEKSTLGIKSGLFAGGVTAAYDILTELKAGKYKGMSKYKAAKRMLLITGALFAAGGALGVTQDLIINSIRRKKSQRTRSR